MSRQPLMCGIPPPATFNPHIPSSRTGSNPSLSGSIGKNNAARVHDNEISRATTYDPVDLDDQVVGGTWSSGPSGKEPELVTSTWSIGWQTPFSMITGYVLALLIAIAHLILFRYIDNRNADGPDRVAPQTYITTASNVLANAFGFCLRGSLAVAFVQHLWRLMRASAMKVSTIESLFCVRANPFLLYKGTIIKAAPTLCLLALLMLGTQIATSFPPGAITVASVQVGNIENILVPTFNASFMGNGSGTDAENFALFPLAADDVADGFISTGVDDGRYNNLLPRMAFSILADGAAFDMPSPCGVNCSYVVEFEAPYLNCQNITRTKTINQNASIYAIYNGAWSDSPIRGYNGTFMANSYNVSTLTLLSGNSAALSDGENPSITVQENNVTCLPERAKSFGGNPFGTTPANWSDYSASIYRDMNHVLIIDSLLYYLQGNFTANPKYAGTALNASQVATTTEPITSDIVWDQSLVNGNEPEPDTTNMIDRTRFNTAFQRFNRNETANPQFDITQDILNDHLFNLTTSVMMAFDFWSTPANAKVLKQINIYTFSQPFNLIIPYFLSLVLALPFVMMGMFALFKNGVSAQDGGFMQIVTTSTGSSILDRAAAGGCLGGNESAPQELKDLKIRFGEFIGRDQPGSVRRAGFGIESEVTDLKKGRKYGVARWI